MTPGDDLHTGRPVTRAKGMMGLMGLRLIQGGASLALGHFKSITTRDAAGIGRDGEAYYAWNALESRGHPLQYEAQFADGTWMICDAVELQAGFFTCGQITPLSLPAVTFGRSLTKSASPVVAQRVVEDLLSEANFKHAWDGETVTLIQNGLRLRPRPDGLYELSFLGWEFKRVDNDHVDKMRTVAPQASRTRPASLSTGLHHPGAVDPCHPLDS